MMDVTSRSPLILAVQAIPGVIVVVAVDVIVLAPAQADAAVVAPHLAPDLDPGETAGAGLLPDPGPVIADADPTAEMTADVALAAAEGLALVAAAVAGHKAEKI